MTYLTSLTPSQVRETESASAGDADTLEFKESKVKIQQKKPHGFLLKETTG